MSYFQVASKSYYSMVRGFATIIKNVCWLTMNQSPENRRIFDCAVLVLSFGENHVSWLCLEIIHLNGTKCTTHEKESQFVFSHHKLNKRKIPLVSFFFDISLLFFDWFFDVKYGKSALRTRVNLIKAIKVFGSKGKLSFWDNELGEISAQHFAVSAIFNKFPLIWFNFVGVCHFWFFVLKFIWECHQRFP